MRWYKRNFIITVQINIENGKAQQTKSTECNCAECTMRERMSVWEKCVKVEKKEEEQTESEKAGEKRGKLKTKRCESRNNNEEDALGEDEKKRWVWTRRKMFSEGERNMHIYTHRLHSLKRPNKVATRIELST